MPPICSRRQFCRRAASAALLAPLVRASAGAEVVESDAIAPIRTVTRGPGFHWFGYYDKDQFSADGRLLLGNRVEFEHRSPAAEDAIRVGMVDLADGDRWIELGTTVAWNWQQGCMLQWRPGRESEAIWNDRDGDRFIARICDVRTGARRSIGAPVYALSPDGRWAVSPDFRRLNDVRPGYGYAGLDDPRRAAGAPDDTGIWHVDLEDSRQRLILSFADVVRLDPPPGGFPEGAKHWVNHLLVAPDGRRFVFLHRWRVGDEKGWKTRMITADPDGRNPWVLIPNGKVSHFVWRDAGHIFAYAGVGEEAKEWDFQVFRDRTREAVPVPGMLKTDGHGVYIPGRGFDWIACDTYPKEKRLQTLYLVHQPTLRRIVVGRFESPPPYVGEWRCDLHPRCSRDGRWICIDSPHGGSGRQMHLVDIGAILG